LRLIGVAEVCFRPRRRPVVMGRAVEQAPPSSKAFGREDG
jgi:hypothetical protein